MTTARLARHAFRGTLGNYWFAVNAGLLLAGGLLLMLFGQRDVDVLGYRGTARAVAGLMQLILFVGPLMALFPSAASIAGKRERGTLDYLLAQPVTRGEVFTGAWWGVAAAAVLSLVLGLGATGGLAAARGVAPGTLLAVGGLAVLLLLVFVSLGLAISAAVETQGRATSLSLTAWIAFLALGSLGLMGAFVGWRMPASVLETWAFVNPVEAFRMAALTVLDPGLHTLGPVGAGLAERLGSGRLAGLSVSSLLAWTGLGFWAGHRTFTAPARRPWRNGSGV